MSTHSPETSTTTTHEERTDGAGRFDRGGTPAATPSSATSGRATASLVLGILSIPAALLMAFLGLVVGIVGLVLGITAKGDIRRRGLTNMNHAKWGVILSGIGIAVSIVTWIVAAIIISS